MVIVENVFLNTTVNRVKAHLRDTPQQQIPTITQTILKVPTVLPFTYELILKQINPSIVDTLLLRITDSFHNPNCTQTILNNPDLADAHRPFQQDCPPMLV